jgi:hypothetical protein
MRPERRLKPGVDGGLRAASWSTAARPKDNGDHALMLPGAARTELVSVEKTVPGVHIEKPTWRSCE